MPSILRLKPPGQRRGTSYNFDTLKSVKERKHCFFNNHGHDFIIIIAEPEKMQGKTRQKIIKKA